MLQKWLLWLLSRICFMADSLYFFSLQSGFTLGKWLLSFAQDSSTLSSILNWFGDQITNKNTKTYTKWLKSLSRVLNMPIELKGLNYYSKVFKRINYRLSNSTFWVVIMEQYWLCGRVMETLVSFIFWTLTPRVIWQRKNYSNNG